MGSTNQIVAEALERHQLPHAEQQPLGKFRKLFPTRSLKLFLDAPLRPDVQLPHAARRRHVALPRQDAQLQPGERQQHELQRPGHHGRPQDQLNVVRDFKLIIFHFKC